MATLTLELPEPILKRIELSVRNHGRTIEAEAAELLESAIKMQDALDKANEKAAADALEIEDLKAAADEIKKYAPGFLDRIAADFARRKAKSAADDIILARLSRKIMGKTNIGAANAAEAATEVNPPLITDRDQLALKLDASQGDSQEIMAEAATK